MSKLRILLLASLLCITPVACNSGKAVIEGDTAKIEMKLNHATFVVQLAPTAQDVAYKVYAVAKANPEAKRAEVKLMMARQSLQDKYGNAPPEDQLMGTINVPDLDEVRKHVDADNYVITMKPIFAAQISTMQYAKLLRWPR
jgi:hypothetical protein